MRSARLTLWILTLLLGVLAADVAHAEDAAAPNSALYERGGAFNTGLVLGAKFGGSFGQPFGDLGASLLPELELGYNLPFLDRSFELFLSAAYAQPKAEGKVGDARLPGEANYSVKQQQAIVSLGLLYRLHLSNKLVRPYLAAGPRLYAMRSEVKGSADGQSFGKNEETATKVGVFGAIGVELHLGPGALLIEASLGWAKLDGYVLRDTSVGTLGASLGYRFFL